MTLTSKIVVACGALLGLFVLSLVTALAEVYFLATLGMGAFILVSSWILFTLYAIGHRAGVSFATK